MMDDPFDDFCIPSPTADHMGDINTNSYNSFSNSNGGMDLGMDLGMDFGLNTHSSPIGISTTGQNLLEYGAKPTASNFTHINSSVPVPPPTYTARFASRQTSEGLPMWAQNKGDDGMIGQKSSEDSQESEYQESIGDYI